MIDCSSIIDDDDDDDDDSYIQFYVNELLSQFNTIIPINININYVILSTIVSLDLGSILIYFSTTYVNTSTIFII